jgi:hypothetical protein
MGYLSFVYDTDVYQDHRLPDHEAMKGLLGGQEGFIWTLECQKELVGLERASGIAFADVGLFFQASSTKRFLGKDAITKCPKGCMRFNLCTCATEKAPPKQLHVEKKDPSVTTSECLREYDIEMAGLGDMNSMSTGLYSSAVHLSRESSVGSCSK